MIKIKLKPGYKYHTTKEPGRWTLHIEGHKGWTVTHKGIFTPMGGLKKFSEALAKYVQDVDGRPMTEIGMGHYVYSETDWTYEGRRMIVYFTKAVWNAVADDKAFLALLATQQAMGNATIFPNVGGIGQSPEANLMSISDAIVLYEQSDSSLGYAKKLGLELYFWPDVPQDVHITEKNCPRQALAFRETLGRMYRVHCSKNRDYSPANILGTGFVGLVTRLWDKVARLMNLSGFQLHIAEPAVYTQPKAPINEGIEDTLMDSAIYSIIGLLLLHGEWGK